MTNILVLDDSPEITVLLRMGLERQGFNVTIGRNGAEGLALLRQRANHPDLIICNLRMPIMDGYAFLDAIRSQAEWASIPVLVLTALSYEENRREAFARGANAFLPKPFRFDDLNALIGELGVSA
ncbi:MAG TPA: response regulator [Phototrophicaceae bacterium]|jgi:CheY-like chemotaxis protein|nr:response regulator [Phototrophicaceae bacterium]